MYFYTIHHLKYDSLSVPTAKCKNMVLINTLLHKVCLLYGPEYYEGSEISAQHDKRGGLNKRGVRKQ